MPSTAFSLSSSSTSGSDDTRVLRCTVQLGARSVRLRVSPDDSIASIMELATAKLCRQLVDDRDYLTIVGLHSRRLERGAFQHAQSLHCSREQPPS